MTTEETHLKYIANSLMPEILSKLPNETLVSSETVHAGGLDGFMSALYNIKLKTKTAQGDIKERLLITKFMKGDVEFRATSKSYTQFANEIFIYAKVLPAYDQMLKASNVNDVTVENWVAPAYVAKFGYIEGLSATPEERESVLVLEHLQPHGYRLGPRLYLNRDHLFNMCKVLGEYHALSYAMRELDPDQLTRLKNEIVPLPFINDADPLDAKQNLYRELYRAAFDRFFDYLDHSMSHDIALKSEVELLSHLQRIRKKYFDEPTRLLERLRTQIEESEEDRHWGVILHGDYNRNNVLFSYKPSDKEQEVVEEDMPEEGKKEGVLLDVSNVKMIDFQELRYGSPALDLSFFMYFNTPGSIREEIWMEMLKKYHGHMFSTLSSIWKANKTDPKELATIDEKLKKYSFDKFVAHFSRYAFYGVMICLHFLPWMLCSEEECSQLSKLFESDMHSDEFHKLSISAGGDEVNVRLLQILRHASHTGYLDNI